MISLNRSLCDGCGICVQSCHSGAIATIDGNVLIDVTLCDGCEPMEILPQCVQVCPAKALIWHVEQSPEAAPMSALAITEDAVDHLPVQPGPERELVVARRMAELQSTSPAPQPRAILPVVAGTLVWLGRDIVPRLVPLALHALDRAVDRTAGWSTRGTGLSERRMAGGREGRRQRHRHRGH